MGVDCSSSRHLCGRDTDAISIQLRHAFEGCREQQKVITEHQVKGIDEQLRRFEGDIEQILGDEENKLRAQPMWPS